MQEDLLECSVLSHVFVCLFLSFSIILASIHTSGIYTYICCLLYVFCSFSRNIDNLDDIVAVAIEAEFHASNVQAASAAANAGGDDGAASGRPGAAVLPQGAKTLNEPENARLNELYIASRSLNDPLDLERSVSGRIFKGPSSIV